VDRPRLLLADDSVTIQRVVNLTFADEGIDVITVGDGEAALREIAAAHPDIVLADVHMPGPSGYEICSLLRAVEATSKIPVILLVGSFEQFDPEEAERAGADAFVTKPFQPIRQLVDQVKELLARNTNAEASVEKVPDVETANVEAVHAGVEYDTTDIESLYNQSFAETVEMGPEVAAEVAAAAYASDRLDDEMIETSYTAEQPNEQVDLGSAAENNQFYGEPPLDVEATQYSTAPPLHPAEIVPAYEETLQMDRPPAIAAEQAHSAHTAPTEELRRDFRDPFATTTDAFDLDDLDLLDLTPANATEEYTITTPADAVSQGGNKQVVTLSPELLEVIVQKVVEKISEKY
jgi:CheY-like chemotaxis protein